MKQAEAQYGFTLISTIQVEGLGVVMQLTNTPIKPGPVSIAPVKGWQDTAGGATPAIT